MAFIDGSAVISAESVLETPAELAKPAVAPRDLKLVRFAGGAMLALLIVDVALYLPRFF